MRILIFGGTTEGREAAERLAADGYDVTVSVATRAGADELDGCGCRVLTGRLDEEEIEELLDGFDIVADATHPYAGIVTENIKEACGRKNTRYVRILRKSSPTEGCTVVSGMEEAAEYLGERQGNILVTTGSKELDKLCLPDPSRIFPRVLPVVSSLEKCEEAGIPSGNIIAMKGPFTTELNEVLIKQFSIKYILSKDGGREGGFPEKLKAAKNTGCELVLIRRPEETGISLERFLEEIKRTKI